MIRIWRRCGLIAVVTFFPAVAFNTVIARPPNVVLILTDNQGEWTLGCYGNHDIQTPNIDRLAREGILFRRCFSSNAVCSPTRATLLTGLIPSQHGVHSYLPAGGAQVGPHAHSTIAEFRTLPEILADAGYTCGLCGKWHLGDNLHPQKGFSYWVTMPEGHTRTFYGARVIEDGKIRKESRYLTDFWTDRGVKFIQENKDKPFFLYLAYNGPYGLGASMLRPARNRYAAYYADKELPSFPREKMDPRQIGEKKLLNNVHAMRRYAAEISGIDDGVGRILDTLDANNIADQTLVIFTADQGLAAGQNGFWGMGDKTRPLTAFDWTMHVPLIYRHPGHINPAQHSKIMVSNYDFLPTLLDYLGLAGNAPRKPSLPGRSYAPTLMGKQQPWDNVVFFEFENTRAIRTDNWKYVGRFPNGPNELYDLASDPAERHNLVDVPVDDAMKNKLHKRMNEFFDRYADPRYDLSRGGRSKAPRRSQ
ncbi:MAG TPA: sulfatase-like hydrolase/transferase [Lacipirellulaceae bacterium]|nr:sulfatase-like hydrolase/transferase [Lacipirellulaceae bacterium]